LLAGGGWGRALVQHRYYYYYYYYAYAGSVDRIFLPPTLGGGVEGVVVKMCGSKAGCLSSLFSLLMWLSAARQPVR